MIAPAVFEAGAIPLSILAIQAREAWNHLIAATTDEEAAPHDEQFGRLWDTLREAAPATPADAIAKAAFFGWYRDNCGGTPAYDYSPAEACRDVLLMQADASTLAACWLAINASQEADDTGELIYALEQTIFERLLGKPAAGYADLAGKLRVLARINPPEPETHYSADRLQACLLCDAERLAGAGA